jgi:exodeoxyribonuclease VII large subunit
VRLAASLRANAEAHRNRIGSQGERVAALGERAQRAARLLLRHRLASLDRCGQMLNALSHRGVLARGFALVRDLEGRPLPQAAAVAPGMDIEIEFSDGRVRAETEGSRGPAGKPDPMTTMAKPRGRRGGGDQGQGSLFG